MIDDYVDAVSSLSYTIRTTLQRMELERHMPSRDADNSDDLIKAASERVKLLRRLREEYENEMAKPL